MMAILSRMHALRHLLFLFSICLLPAMAWAAEEDTLPPPTEVQDVPEASETVVPADEFNLHKEFAEPEPGEEVEVRSYQRKDGATVTEYSVRGHVYMVRVQPIGGLPAYYLYDSDGDGIMERRLPGGYKRLSPPMWVIKRF